MLRHEFRTRKGCAVTMGGNIPMFKTLEHSIKIISCKFSCNKVVLSRMAIKVHQNPILLLFDEMHCESELTKLLKITT